MSNPISNDYLKMINSKGSGYNIPVIVDAIVDAVITPMKATVTAKKDLVDASISGMATLKSSTLSSKTSINSMTSGAHNTLKQSPNSNFMRSSISDTSKLVEGANVIENVIVGKPQLWRLDGETSLTRSISNQTITIEFGTNAEDDSGWAASVPARSEQIVWSGDNLSSAIAKLNNIVGLKAEIIQLDSNSSTYSVSVSSEPGAKNGFKMSNNANTGWKTASDGAGDAFQQSTDTTFKLNGTSYTRSSNVVTDAVLGLTLEFLSTNVGAQNLTVSKSSINIQKTVETLIDDLNAYKANLNALGFIDEFGDNNGDLAYNSSLRGAKNRLSTLLTSPIKGFGENEIFFVDFGIKTGSDGLYQFDKTTFDRTYSQNPQKFDALTEDKAYASDPSISVVALGLSKIPAGKHAFTASGPGNKLNLGTAIEKDLSVTGTSPTYTFSTSDYPGFAFSAGSNAPNDFNIYVGKSVKNKLLNFFDQELGVVVNNDAITALYKDSSTGLSLRLEEIDQRRLLLEDRYTKQFIAMEQAVTELSSSEDYIKNLVENWNKS